MNQRGKAKKGIPLPNLTLWRDWRGMSQDDVVAAAGIGKATISRIENGANARYETVDRLCKALRLSREQLLHKTPPENERAA